MNKIEQRNYPKLTLHRIYNLVDPESFRTTEDVTAFKFAFATAIRGHVNYIVSSGLIENFTTKVRIHTQHKNAQTIATTK